MENMDNLLYSLIPLVLVIVLSWLFSFLGSRRKRQAEGTESVATTRSGDQFFDLFPVREDELHEEPEIPRPDDVRTIRDAAWPPNIPTRGPEPAPKPITPKWWGA
jgi:hypothetical protein